MATKTIYWRRANEYPAGGIRDIRVLDARDWGFPTLERAETHDTGWHKLVLDLHAGGAGDIWDSLGLCGDLHDPVAIADGVVIAAAIMAHAGIAPPLPADPVYDCPWRPEDIIDGGTTSKPSPAYEELQAACAAAHEELRRELAEQHGIEIAPLANA